ncbi:hypothetical protein V6N12_007111 [Hibiscus sabdariffa]|uniref:Uncharacterized protein n=1 Tax=Hibiscus sabdariffa TaxID=183260 RepID=A0ABR2F0U4_9ROSI
MALEAAGSGPGGTTGRLSYCTTLIPGGGDDGGIGAKSKFPGSSKDYREIGTFTKSVESNTRLLVGKKLSMLLSALLTDDNLDCPFLRSTNIQGPKGSARAGLSWTVEDCTAFSYCIGFRSSRGWSFGQMSLRWP